MALLFHAMHRALCRMIVVMLSESMQDHLKTIYEIVREGDCATTNAPVNPLGVTAASVTGRHKKLADNISVTES